MIFENIDSEQIIKLSQYADEGLIEILCNLSITSPVIQSVFKFKDEKDLIRRLIVALSISQVSAQKLMEDVNFTINKFDDLKKPV